MIVVDNEVAMGGRVDVTELSEREVELPEEV